MKISKFLILALTGTLFFASCEKDDDIEVIPVETGEYANGIFILNEGNYNSGNSSVSFISGDGLNVINNIYSKENDAAALGDVAQSMGFYEDYALIVVNVSGVLEVVDRTTFESVATIDTELNNPRFVAVSGSKAYVTNWGDPSDPDDDFVSVIDLENFTVESKISVAEGPEKIISEAGKLYVAHKGGYSFGNTISVISAATGNVDKTIEVGEQPNSLQVLNGFLYVSSSGLPYYAVEEKAGSISKISLSTHEVIEDYQFAEATEHPENLDLDNGILYYTLGKEVYTLDPTTLDPAESALLEFEDAAVVYGFEVKNSFIFAASPNADFTGNGKVYVYEASQGNLIATYNVGINPNGVYFNE